MDATILRAGASLAARRRGSWLVWFALFLAVGYDADRLRRKEGGGKC